jgi:two-component system, NarL family, response regulator
VSSYLDQNRFEVVARASRGDDALALIAREQPAIALLDVRMSALTGIEVARRASQVAPKTRIVLFTGYGDRTMLEQALDAGVRAFILKEAPLPELLRALTIVATGGTYVDRELAATLASGQTVGALSPLTKREQEILGLVADGMTNDKVAEALEISPETVQSHVRNAMAKLDADTRTQAVATAFRRSLLV